MNKQSEHQKHRSGVFSGVIFIFYCIFVAIEGYYDTPFGDHPYSFWLDAYLRMLMWILIIVGIPFGIIGIVYLILWVKKYRT